MENSEHWKALGLSSLLCERLTANGLTNPTAIQAEAIPALLGGRDVSARSQTGTGKTLAYLLPLLQQLNAESKAIQGVIIAPTQELAMQIVRVADYYAEPLGIRVQQLIGGAALKRQIEKLKLHPQLIIGTPGRIHELHKLNKLKLHHVTQLVIDEADQVFELGSTKEVETLLFAFGRDRQVSFFSATYPEQMSRFEGRWMKDPLRIQIAPQHRVSETIDNYYIVSDKRDKTDTARRIIRLLNPRSALLFLNDTDQISNWESKLKYEGFTVEAIYGDADKQRRAATLARFREGGCQLLLATDVAARGLDIEGLPLVINLDPPFDADHYVHRAGRTGRMGRKGTVMSIVTPQELFIVDKFRKQLEITLDERTMFRGKLLNEEQLREATKFKRNASDSKGSAKSKSMDKQNLRQGRQSVSDASSSIEETSQSPKVKRSSVSKPAHASETSKPKAAQPVKSQKSAAKQERKRNNKDKGAPKWLKAKREESK